MELVDGGAGAHASDGGELSSLRTTQFKKYDIRNRAGLGTRAYYRQPGAVPGPTIGNPVPCPVPRALGSRQRACSLGPALQVALGNLPVRLWLPEVLNPSESESPGLRVSLDHTKTQSPDAIPS